MTHAYTPGLKVSEQIRLVKRRILPLYGDVLVHQGDTVQPDTVVARTELPGNITPINAANKIGVPPEEVEMLLTRKKGELMKKGDVFALHKSFFGLFRTRLTAPHEGWIESISKVTGHVLFRGLPIPVERTAYLRGRVHEIFPREGVSVETIGAFVQGIFGIGGETFGPLKMVSSSNEEVLDDSSIDNSCRGCILVGGSLVTATALRKAISAGARGILVGGFDSRDLRDFLGYDLGVAITGTEKLGITLIITEGFGRIAMAEHTFDLLRNHEGEEACINGATQIRAGVIRPEVVIPAKQQRMDDIESLTSISSLNIGTRVRIIREPYFGQLGHVSDLPPQLEKLESESKARILKAKLSDGREVTVPRANVEMVE